MATKQPHKCRVYYFNGNMSDGVSEKLLSGGIDALPHYDCDWYSVDSDGFVICRKATGDDCEEFVIRGMDFVGAKQFWGVRKMHRKQIRAHKQMVKTRKKMELENSTTQETQHTPPNNSMDVI